MEQSESKFDIAESKFELGESVVFQAIDGETILLNVDSGEYYGMGAVETDIWHLLAREGSIQVAVQHLASKYDADVKTILRDIQSFVSQLLQEGLLKATPMSGLATPPR